MRRKHHPVSDLLKRSSMAAGAEAYLQHRIKYNITPWVALLIVIRMGGT